MARLKVDEPIESTSNDHAPSATANQEAADKAHHDGSASAADRDKDEGQEMPMTAIMPEMRTLRNQVNAAALLPLAGRAQRASSATALSPASCPMLPPIRRAMRKSLPTALAMLSGSLWSSARSA
jgi:hypothetical protein